MKKIDPIRKKFDFVERIEACFSALFYSSAILTFASLIFGRSSFPLSYNIIQVLLILSVICFFITGLTLRLYLIPRQERARKKDFFSNVYKISLTYEQTQGYYNSDLLTPGQRIAANTLENSFFSKSIISEMLCAVRWKTALFFILWVIIAYLYNIDLAVEAAAAQAVYSEQILSKWIRMEWLRMSFEKSFSNIYNLFLSKPANEACFDAMALEYYSYYETAKANAGILLSKKIFDRLNPHLSTEWKKIKKSLNI